MIIYIITKYKIYNRKICVKIPGMYILIKNRDRYRVFKLSSSDFFYPNYDLTYVVLLLIIYEDLRLFFVMNWKRYYEGVSFLT